MEFTDGAVERAVPYAGNAIGVHDSGTPVVTADMSGMPVAAPALSAQFTMSSTWVRNSAEVPTSA